jgi:hypothetical protein
MAAPKGYTQHEEVIEVPKGTGLEGFIRTVREVLKLPRVQDIHISMGKIEYTFFLRDGEEKRVVTMNFDTLMPMAVVRNTEVREVSDIDRSAPVALLQMFRASAMDHLAPIAFVTGANSHFWPWYEGTSKMKAEMRDVLAGLPVFADRACPDEVLLLCAAFRKESELVEMKKAYKIAIPSVVTR